MQRYLTQVLKLVVNEEKSSVRLSRDCEYLGFAFTSKRVTISVAPKKLKSFKRRVKELSGCSSGVSMQRRLTDLNRYVRGWIGYFGLAQQFDLFDKLDGWVRRRIRMCFWKQWRRPRTKVKNLVRLGGEPRLCDQTRDQSQKLLASLADTSNAICNAQQMAARTVRTSFAQTTLVRPCSASRNRLMRTRMSGGVGRVVSDGGPYPISAAPMRRTPTEQTLMSVHDSTMWFELYPLKMATVSLAVQLLKIRVQKVM